MVTTARKIGIVLIAWLFTLLVLALVFTGLYFLGLWALTWDAAGWIAASAIAVATGMTILWAAEVWYDL